MAIPPPERPVLRRLDVHRIEDGDNRGVVLVDNLGVVGDQTLESAGLAATIATGQELVEMLQGRREFPEAVKEVLKKVIKRFENPVGSLESSLQLFR